MLRNSGIWCREDWRSITLHAQHLCKQRAFSKEVWWVSLLCHHSQLLKDLWLTLPASIRVSESWIRYTMQTGAIEIRTWIELLLISKRLGDGKRRLIQKCSNSKRFQNRWKLQLEMKLRRKLLSTRLCQRGPWHAMCHPNCKLLEGISTTITS